MYGSNPMYSTVISASPDNHPGSDDDYLQACNIAPCLAAGLRRAVSLNHPKPLRFLSDAVVEHASGLFDPSVPDPTVSASDSGRYFRRHNLAAIISDILQQIVTQRPSMPIVFLANRLREMHQRESRRRFARPRRSRRARRSRRDSGDSDSQSEASTASSDSFNSSSISSPSYRSSSRSGSSRSPRSRRPVRRRAGSPSRGGGDHFRASPSAGASSPDTRGRRSRSTSAAPAQWRGTGLGPNGKHGWGYNGRAGGDDEEGGRSGRSRRGGRTALDDAKAAVVAAAQAAAEARVAAAAARKAAALHLPPVDEAVGGRASAVRGSGGATAIPSGPPRTASRTTARPTTAPQKGSWGSPPTYHLAGEALKRLTDEGGGAGRAPRPTTRSLLKGGDSHPAPSKATLRAGARGGPLGTAAAAERREAHVYDKDGSYLWLEDPLTRDFPADLVAALRKQRIDDYVVVTLTTTQVHSLGLPFGHRRRILAFLQAYQQRLRAGGGGMAIVAAPGDDNPGFDGRSPALHAGRPGKVKGGDGGDGDDASDGAKTTTRKGKKSRSKERKKSRESRRASREADVAKLRAELAAKEEEWEREREKLRKDRDQEEKEKEKEKEEKKEKERRPPRRASNATSAKPSVVAASSAIEMEEEVIMGSDAGDSKAGGGSAKRSVRSSRSARRPSRTGGSVRKSSVATMEEEVIMDGDTVGGGSKAPSARGASPTGPRQSSARFAPSDTGHESGGMIEEGSVVIEGSVVEGSVASGARSRRSQKSGKSGGRPSRKAASSAAGSFVIDDEQVEEVVDDDDGVEVVVEDDRSAHSNNRSRRSTSKPSEPPKRRFSRSSKGGPPSAVPESVVEEGSFVEVVEDASSRAGSSRRGASRSAKASGSRLGAPSRATSAAKSGSRMGSTLVEDMEEIVEF